MLTFMDKFARQFITTNSKTQIRIVFEVFRSGIENFGMFYYYS